MKGPASHFRHIKSKKLFQKARVQVENRRKIERHAAKKSEP
jgi:hypothetical protein